MGQPQNAWSFPDCRIFMDKAIEAESGWQVTFESKGHAMNFRMRCYTARDRERRRNKKVFTDEDHPLHNSTIWHNLTLSIQQDDKRLLCDNCRQNVNSQWKVLAIQGDNSLEHMCVSNGPL